MVKNNRYMITEIRVVSIVAVLVLALSGIAAELKVGSEVSVIVPTTGKRIVVRLPSDYDATRRWPVVFHFHSAGGKPNATLLLNHGVGDHSILVGMSYLERGKSTGKPEPDSRYVSREHKHFRATLTWLLQHAAIDTERVYLTGVSKGGWHVTDLLEREAGKIAGAAILLAGRAPMVQAGAVPTAIRQMPIYIGVGENDANLVAGLRAKLAYGKAGALVTLEIYEGLGHQYPANIPRLKAWFNTQQLVRKRSVSAETRKRLTGECQAIYKAALAEADVGEQYRQLRTLADDPRLPWCGEQVYRGIWSNVSEIGSLPSAGTGWKAEKGLLNVVQIETNLRRIADYAEILRKLTAIQNLSDPSLYGRIAGQLITPYQQAYNRSLEATRRANANAQAPTPAPAKTISPFQSMTGNGDAPKRIIRRGNKVIFER
jgi:poly(3-hydroxybutyrate) depolymerase